MLRRSDVLSVMKWPALIQATRDALVAIASPDAAPSSSSQLIVPGSSLHLKTGALLTPPVISVKANLRPDRGTASGAILVFDHAQQQLRAIVASADLTAMRTGAIAAVAAKALVHGEAPIVAIIGAGPVARQVNDAVMQVLTPGEVRIWSRSIQRAHALVDDLGSMCHRILPSVAEAVHGADLIVTCTPAREPLVRDSDLLPTGVVLAMGADTAGKRELAPGVLDRAIVYADVPADALLVGESAYLDTGHSSRVTAIGSLLAREYTVPDQSARLVFDSVGAAAVDAAAVAMVMSQAHLNDIGSILNLD